MEYTMVYLARGLSIFMDSNSLSIANYYFWNLKSDHSHIYIYTIIHPSRKFWNKNELMFTSNLP